MPDARAGTGAPGHGHGGLRRLAALQAHGARRPGDPEGSATLSAHPRPLAATHPVLRRDAPVGCRDPQRAYAPISTDAARPLAGQLNSTSPSAHTLTLIPTFRASRLTVDVEFPAEDARTLVFPSTLNQAPQTSDASMTRIMNGSCCTSLIVPTMNGGTSVGVLQPTKEEIPTRREVINSRLNIMGSLLLNLLQTAQYAAALRPRTCGRPRTGDSSSLGGSRKEYPFVLVANIQPGQYCQWMDLSRRIMGFRGPVGYLRFGVGNPAADQAAADSCSSAPP
jgi:hypothetical protein